MNAPEQAVEKLCAEPGCPVDVGRYGDYCAHHYGHSFIDGECGPGCPLPYKDPTQESAK